MRVAGAGYCCMDVYEHLNAAYPTGNSVDFAVHMSRFGIRTSLVSAVGNDAHGTEMIELLDREGIDRSHLHIQEGQTAVIRMRLDGNNRVHGDEEEGVMAEFTLTQNDIAFIRSHDWMHTDLFGKVLHQLPIFKQAGLGIIFDFSTFLDHPDVDTLLPNVDYAFFSYEGHRDAFIEDFLVRAKSPGPKAVTATLGVHGSLVYDGERFLSQDIVPVDVVNTVGAGDSYIAGFMFGVIQGRPLQACMAIGAETASAVVAKFEPY
jgi:fructoselysine 6-kinase